MNRKVESIIIASLVCFSFLIPFVVLGADPVGTLGEGAACDPAKSKTTDYCQPSLICGFSNSAATSKTCINPNPNETLKKDVGTLATKEGIQNVLEAIVNWVFAVMVVVGTIFVILAAFQFVTGGGDPAKVAEARQKLIWAILGFAVAVLARAILPLVKSLLGIT